MKIRIQGKFQSPKTNLHQTNCQIHDKEETQTIHSRIENKNTVEALLVYKNDTGHCNVPYSTNKRNKV